MTRMSPLPRTRPDFPAPILAQNSQNPRYYCKIKNSILGSQNRDIVGEKQRGERRDDEIMMGPEVMLRFILMNASSHGAIDFVTSPRIFAVRIEAGYGTSAAQGRLSIAPSLKAPLTLLAWMQMWLRLVLGLEPGAALAQGTIAATPISYRQVEPSQLKKEPAHNLEALMRFAPDAGGQGLTLNQYRERFTRLSVMGRLQIYHVLALLSRKGRKYVRRCLASWLYAPLCHAPLRPD